MGNDAVDKNDCLMNQLVFVIEANAKRDYCSSQIIVNCYLDNVSQETCNRELTAK